MSTDAEKLKQKQKIRKYLVFTGMFLLFLGCMWLIFAPSEKERQEAERKTGFNAELPDPKGTGIEADKMAAYEQADMIRRQEAKKRTLADFSALTDGHRQDNVPKTEPAQDIASENESRAYNSGGNGRTGAFASSASAYNDINATLGSFYESPEEDPEKEALKAEVEQLRQAAAAQTAGPSYDSDGMLPYDFARHYDADAQFVVGTDYYPETGREVISYLRTGAVGVGTPRGVKVGDSEKALLTEYPEALYCIAADESELYDGYSDESGYSEPAYDFDRAYVWQPQTPQDDGNYDVRDIAFYLKDGTVSAITMTKPYAFRFAYGVDRDAALRLAEEKRSALCGQ